MRQYTLWLLHILFLYGAYAGIIWFSIVRERVCGFNKVHSYVCTTHAPVLSVQHLQNETILWLATAVHQQTFKVSEHVDQHYECTP